MKNLRTVNLKELCQIAYGEVPATKDYRNYINMILVDAFKGIRKQGGALKDVLFAMDVLTGEVIVTGNLLSQLKTAEA